jgi:hypothetical protein
MPIWCSQKRPYTGGARDVIPRPEAPAVIWIALPLIAFVAIGLSRGASARSRHRLVFMVSIAILGVMYLTFGSP